MNLALLFFSSNTLVHLSAVDLVIIVFYFALVLGIGFYLKGQANTGEDFFMGHKWMWNVSLGGLPPESFLAKVDPLLAGARDKLEGEYATSDKIAGTLSPQWAEKLGLRAGIPIPVGAFDAHWDAIGAGAKEGDVVNVVGTSTCIIAYAQKAQLIPGVCGVVAGSVHPQFTGIEAGLSATGDIFSAIARRAGTTVEELSKGLDKYRAGQTGLLRMPRLLRLSSDYLT